MDIETDRRIQLLTDLLYAKEWQQVLPDPAIDLLTAVLGPASHVRDANDARLQRSPDSRAGLSTLVRLPGSPSQKSSLAELLDLMTASGLLVIDQRGEYEVNVDAPHMRHSAACPLLTLLAPARLPSAGKT